MDIDPETVEASQFFDAEPAFVSLARTVSGAVDKIVLLAEVRFACHNSGGSRQGLSD